MWRGADARASQLPKATRVHGAPKNLLLDHNIDRLAVFRLSLVSSWPMGSLDTSFDCTDCGAPHPPAGMSSTRCQPGESACTHLSNSPPPHRGQLTDTGRTSSHGSELDPWLDVLPVSVSCRQPAWLYESGLRPCGTHAPATPCPLAHCRYLPIAVVCAPMRDVAVDPASTRKYT